MYLFDSPNFLSLSHVSLNDMICKQLSPQVNCDVDDRTCHDHQISKLPRYSFFPNNNLLDF